VDYRQLLIIVIGVVAVLSVIGDIVLAVEGHDQTGLLKVAGTSLGVLGILAGISHASKS